MVLGTKQDSHSSCSANNEFSSSWYGSDKLDELDSRLAEFVSACPDFAARLRTELCSEFNVLADDRMFWSGEHIVRLPGTSGFNNAVVHVLRSACCYDLSEWYESLSWDNGDIFDEMLVEKFLA